MMPRRIVASESSKCRLGRDIERVVSLRPSGLGGENLRAFGNGECVRQGTAKQLAIAKSRTCPSRQPSAAQRDPKFTI